jgi:hypothetical protein
MTLNWESIPRPRTPFEKLHVGVPSRELQEWARLELTRQRGVLFNTVFLEPESLKERSGERDFVPPLPVIQGVVLDTLTETQNYESRFELQLLDKAFGSRGESGRSVRIVRHALQISNLFHSYFKMGRTPADAPPENVNRGWQTQLWEACKPRILEKCSALLQGQTTPVESRDDATYALLELPAPVKSDSLQVHWSTSTSTRGELRYIAKQIADGIRNNEFANLNLVAVVLPPAKTQEYAAQISSIFTEEFNIPFVLHESLGNLGVGYSIAFAKLLETLHAGCTRDNIKELLEHDAFRMATNRTEERLLKTWIRQLGVVSGLTSSDLEHTFVTDEAERNAKFHWMQAIDRLCLIALKAADAAFEISVPRGSLELVQRLTKMFLALEAFQQRVKNQKASLHTWSQDLRDFAVNLFSESVVTGEPSAQREYAKLLRIIDSCAFESSESSEFDFAMVLELIRRPLMRGHARRSGRIFQHGVAVFTLRPGALRVPFTHVFVAGAEDGQMPRVDRIPGTHLFPSAALQLEDTPKNRDLKSMAELLSMPKRKISISHVERNVANGERKRPSHELLSMLGESFSKEDIRPAPSVILIDHNTLSGNPQQLDAHSPPATNEIPEYQGSILEEFHQKRFTVRILEDVVLCPVLARSKHVLRIAERPLQEQAERYPDVELGFLGEKELLKQVAYDWMKELSRTPEQIRDKLIEFIKQKAEARALPARQNLEFELDVLFETLLPLAKSLEQLRPAEQFSLGRTASATRSIVLPEITLGNGWRLNGRLPTVVNFDEKTTTSIAIAASSLPKEKATIALPFEGSAKAMLSLCLLRCQNPENTTGRTRELLQTFHKTEQWRILCVSSQSSKAGHTREKIIPAWSAERAKNWLCSLIDLVQQSSSPGLLPLKRISKSLEDRKCFTAINPKIEINNERVFAAVSSDFEREDLGHFPYDNRTLPGNFLMNMPLEEEIGEKLRERYPWIFE